MLVDGRPVSASLFDIALFLRWNGLASVARGSGPYVYLAKLESRHEAELWNDVFIAAQEAVGLPRGTIRATVLIETITASFEMEEILYALREHSAGPQRRALGLHLQRHQEVPRRPGVRPAGPLRGDDGRAVHARLHRAARARLPPARRARDRRHGGLHPEPGRHASTSRPSRACARTRSARPARASTAPGSRTPASCRSRARSSTRCWATGPTRSRACARTSTPDGAALLALDRTPGEITLAGVQTNVSVGLRYLDSLARAASAPRRSTTSWRTPRRPRSRAPSCGSGSATACRTSEGETITPELYARERDAVLARLAGDGREHLGEAAEILDGLVLDEGFAPFLTLRAGRLLP